MDNQEIAKILNKQNIVNEQIVNILQKLMNDNEKQKIINSIIFKQAKININDLQYTKILYIDNDMNIMIDGKFLSYKDLEDDDICIDNLINYDLWDDDMKAYICTVDLLLYDEIIKKVKKLHEK